MEEKMEKPQGQEDRFISFLQGLAPKKERGALATLRLGLGRDHPPAEALRILMPRLPSGEENEWKRRWYFQVAALFALHPEPGGHGNLGEVFHRLGNNASAEKRFVNLLNSTMEDLPHRLRQAVSLAKSKEVPIDWRRLLDDLLNWNRESRSVQYKWAESYWQKEKVESTPDENQDLAASEDK